MTQMEGKIPEDMFEYVSNLNVSLTNNIENIQKELSMKELELQHSNTAWQEKYSALEDKFLKEKKRLRDEVLERDSEALSLINKNLYLTHCLTKTKRQLNERQSVPQEDKAWQQKYTAMEDKLTQEVKQLKGQIQQRDAEILDLNKTALSLSQTLKQAISRVNTIGSEQEENKSWQEKYNAMEEKFSKELVEKEERWECLRIEAEKQIKQLKRELRRKDSELHFKDQELSNRVRAGHLQEKQLHQKTSQRKGLKKDSFSQTEATSQLNCVQSEPVQNNKDWQDKHTALMAEKERWETLQTEADNQITQLQKHIQQKETEFLELKSTNKHLSDWVTLEMENRGQEVLRTNEDWQKKMKALEEKFAKELAEKTCQLSKLDELSQSNQAWQDRYTALEDKLSKELAAKEQSWETLLTNKQKKLYQVEEEIQQKETEILDLCTTKLSLSEKLTEATNLLSSKAGDLLESNKAWQLKYNKLEETFKKELAEKDQSWETKLTMMSEKLNQPTSTEEEEVKIEPEQSGQSEKKEKKKRKGLFRWLHKKKQNKRDDVPPSSP